jgi:hypothetical protein
MTKSPIPLIIMTGFMGAAACNLLDDYSPTDPTTMDECLSIDHQTAIIPETSSQNPQNIIETLSCATIIGVETVFGSKATSNLLGGAVGAAIGGILFAIASKLENRNRPKEFRGF